MCPSGDHPSAEDGRPFPCPCLSTTRVVPDTHSQCRLPPQTPPAHPPSVAANSGGNRSTRPTAPSVPRSPSPSTLFCLRRGLLVHLEAHSPFDPLMTRSPYLSRSMRTLPALLRRYPARGGGTSPSTHVRHPCRTRDRDRARRNGPTSSSGATPGPEGGRRTSTQRHSRDVRSSGRSSTWTPS